MLHGRLPWLRPDELDERAREVYDQIAGGPRAAGPQAFALTDPEGRLHGPFNAMLVTPEVGEPLQALGSAIRYRTSLVGRTREIAILALAAHRKCDFEWYAHARVGEQAGLTSAEIADLRDGRPAETFDRTERAVHQVTLELARTRELSDDTYAAIGPVVGQQTLAELVVLVGYYDLLELMLRTWRVPLPDGEPSAFAEPSPAPSTGTTT